MWGRCCTKWHSDRFFPRNFGFSLVSINPSVLQSYLHVNATLIRTNGPSLETVKGSFIHPDIGKQWAENYFLNDFFLFTVSWGWWQHEWLQDALNREGISSLVTTINVTAGCVFNDGKCDWRMMRLVMTINMTEECVFKDDMCDWKMRLVTTVNVP